MDETIRRDLQTADQTAKALDEQLERICRQLEAKVRRETSWDVECDVGWEEGGLGELVMKPVRGGTGAACCSGAWEAYYRREIAPLFEDLFVIFETPFGMVRGADPEVACPICGMIADKVSGDLTDAGG